MGFDRRQLVMFDDGNVGKMSSFCVASVEQVQYVSLGHPKILPGQLGKDAPRKDVPRQRAVSKSHCNRRNLAAGKTSCLFGLRT